MRFAQLMSNSGSMHSNSTLYIVVFIFLFVMFVFYFFVWQKYFVHTTATKEKNKTHALITSHDMSISLHFSQSGICFDTKQLKLIKCPTNKNLTKNEQSKTNKRTKKNAASEILCLTDMLLRSGYRIVHIHQKSVIRSI